MCRSIADTIRTTATKTRQRAVPLNRDDESRIDAIERELIKLGSEVCCCNDRSSCMSNDFVVTDQHGSGEVLSGILGPAGGRDATSVSALRY